MEISSRGARKSGWSSEPTGCAGARNMMTLGYSFGDVIDTRKNIRGSTQVRRWENRSILKHGVVFRFKVTGLCALF